MDACLFQKRSAPVLLGISNTDLERWTRKAPPATPFVATHSFETIIRLIAHFRTGTPAFPLSPRLPEKMLACAIPPCSGDLFLFTSGSSGSPKIAALSLANFIASAQGSLEALSLEEGDRWLLSLPLYHVGGIAILFRCLLAGATLLVSEDKELATHLSLVPTQLYRLKNEPLPKLKCLLLGGAPCPEALLKRHANLPIVTSYGMTEMASLITSSTRKGVLPGRELIIDANGEILVRGETLFKGYWSDGLHLPLTKEGWFTTGDLGIWENGHLRVIGRKDNLFISGGENIHPEEIEEALLTIDEIVDAKVVPIEDSEWGHRPVAYLKMTRPLSIEEVNKQLEPLLPRFKHPIKLFPLKRESKGLKLCS